MRNPDLTDAKLLNLYHGFSAIGRMRAKDELVKSRELKTARYGVGKGATHLRDTLAGKFKNLTGQVDVDAVRAMLESSYKETEAVAEALMVESVDAYEEEGDVLMEAGDLWHRAMARYWEQGEIPDEAPLRRAVLAQADWMEKAGVLLRPGVESTQSGPPVWKRELYAPQQAQVWCEVPHANPATASAGTDDLVAHTLDNVILADHKTKEFASIRKWLENFKTPPPFHVKPWQSDGMQMADYLRNLKAKEAAIGQADRHGLLREALKLNKPVMAYENYIDRETGESWLLNWQELRLPWQSDTEQLHEGLPSYLLMYDYLRLLWHREKHYYPAGMMGYDLDGSPMPGTLADMAAEEETKRKELKCQN